MTLNSETKTFNLVRAHKYLDKLKSSVSTPKKDRWTPSQYKPNVIINFYNLALISSNNVIFDKNCKEASKENIQQIDNRLNLIRDLKNLKESVYSTNSSIGLS